MYFHFLLLNLFTKGCGPTLRHTWIPITQGWSVPSLGQTDSVFLERKKCFSKQTNAVSHCFSIISSKKKVWPFWSWIRFTQECFVPSVIEIGPKFRRRIQCIFIMSLLSCTGKLSFIWTNVNPIHQRIDSLYQVWLELHGPSLGEVYENVKSLPSDDGKQAIRKAHELKSSGN